MLFTEEALDEQKIEDLGKEIFSEEEESTCIWTLDFDRSCSSSGSGVGVVLIPPKGEPKPMDFKLEFGNMNNMAEYKALLLKIIATKEKGINTMRA